MGKRILAQLSEVVMSDDLPIAKRKKISYERPYNPNPVVKRLKELMEKAQRVLPGNCPGL